jgi:catechol 2,3-dioxygenase-like lactoylglutathione lyase family enzyme
VSNVSQSIEFYRTLGLRLIVHTHDDYARFECPNGDATFSIHRVDTAPSSGSGIWIYFEVENVDETIKSLVEKGVQVEEMPEDKSWLWREARIKDPDSNQIIVYTAGKNRKQPPWRLS